MSGLDDVGERLFGMRRPVLGEVLEQHATTPIKQPRGEQIDDRRGACEPPAARRGTLEREVGLEQMHERILPLRARHRRVRVEHPAMACVEEMRLDERVGTFGEREQRVVARHAMEPRDGEQHERVRVRVAHVRDDPTAPVDREGEACLPRRLPGEVATQRHHRALGELRTIVVPAQEMRLRVDVDLPRLHNGAMWHVDRPAALIEPLAETTVRRIEAECRPRRQRTAGDPVVKCLETLYCHSIPPDLLSSNARMHAVRVRRGHAEPGGTANTHAGDMRARC
jgi:hypothetical protein